MNENTKADGSASIVIQRRIELSDTDASGIWHNSAVFRFMEAAKGALLARLGFADDVLRRHPPVRIEAEFLTAVWFGDVVEVQLRVEAVEGASVQYGCEIRRGDTVCARGRFVAVLVDRIGGETREWPPGQREALLQGGPQSPDRPA